MRIIILGATGFLGSNLFQLASQNILNISSLQIQSHSEILIQLPCCVSSIRKKALLLLEVKHPLV